MRKRAAGVFVGILYAVLVVILLVLQTKTIQGDITRLAANGLTVLLMIPTFLLFRVWLNAQRAGDDGKSGEEMVQDGGEKICAGQEICSDRQQLSTAGQKKEFFAGMERAGLSAREQEVAWLIFRGYSNRQIAEELFISETTVKKHASHIYEKMQISGRKELKSCISGRYFL